MPPLPLIVRSGSLGRTIAQEACQNRQHVDGAVRLWQIGNIPILMRNEGCGVGRQKRERDAKGGKDFRDFERPVISTKANVEEGCAQSMLGDGFPRSDQCWDRTKGPIAMVA